MKILQLLIFGVLCVHLCKLQPHLLAFSYRSNTKACEIMLTREREQGDACQKVTHMSDIELFLSPSAAQIERFYSQFCLHEFSYIYAEDFTNQS
jgi:hypothetical protein